MKTAPEVEGGARHGGDGDEPRQEDEPKPVPATPINEPEIEESADQARAEFDTGTAGRPIDDDMGVDQEELEEGPNVANEQRVQTPSRPPATKRKVGVHNDEPDTKVYHRR